MSFASSKPLLPWGRSSMNVFLNAALPVLLGLAACTSAAVEPPRARAGPPSRPLDTEGLPTRETVFYATFPLDDDWHIGAIGEIEGEETSRKALSSRVLLG